MIGRAAILLTLFGSAPAVAADPIAVPADLAVTSSRAGSDARAALEVGQDRGARFAGNSFARDGASGSSTTMIGSVPLSDGVDIGFGLFSVVGSTEKEMVRRRTDPMREVRGRDSRVAAVGMSLRF